MNVFYLYFVWTLSVDKPDEYVFSYATTNQAEAQEFCMNSDGKAVYTFTEAYYGENS